MKLRKRLLCGLCWLLPVTAGALDLCYEEVPVFPWMYGQNEGLDRYLIQTVAQRLKLPLTFKPLPWKRCQYEVRFGLSDGMFSAGFTHERHEYASFPLQADGQPDKAYRMARDYYRVYRRNGSAMNWQHGQFSQVRIVGIQAGYSVAERLRSQGQRLDESSHDASELLRKLEAGFFDIAVTMQGEAGLALKSSPPLAKHIEVLPEPYQTNDMYLALNKAICQRDPGLCQRLWQEVRSVRESREYQHRARQLGY